MTFCLSTSSYNVNIFMAVSEELVHYNKGITEKLTGRIWMT